MPGPLFEQAVKTLGMLESGENRDFFDRQRGAQQE